MASSQQERASSTEYKVSINPVQAQHDHKNETHITTEAQRDELVRESTPGNLEYRDDDQEPEIHFRTWLAVAAMTILNFVALIALTGPPTMLSAIAADLNGQGYETWVPNAQATVQTVFVGLFASASDAFQSRKLLLVSSALVAFIGACIPPGATGIGRVIAGQACLGLGLAGLPLSFAVASEVLPKKWRPMAQSIVNSGAAGGAIAGPLAIGALVKSNPHQGWRTFYWIQAGLWAATAILTFVGYRPPTRRTHLSHLRWTQKLAHIDLIGCFTLGAGLCLMLTGLGLGGGLYAWSNVRVLATLIIGILVLAAFGLYEWKGTKIGVLDHEMFRHGLASRTFALCLPVAAIEGFVVYSYLVFEPVLTSAVFTTDPLLVAARTVTYYIAVLPGTLLFGYISTKMRSVREVLIVAFIINLGGLIGFAAIQPSQSALPIAMGALQGFGFGGLLSQIIAAAQVSVPHSYIASASAVAIICRALASTVATSIYSTAVNNSLHRYIPAYVAKAAAGAGLPADQIPAFVAAVASGKVSEFPSQATPSIIAAGVVALKQAYADGLRVVPIIAAPLGVLAIVLCCFMGSLRNNMTYHVDAPVEELHAKEKGHNSESALKV